ncbi:hypothetical protein FQZ97_994090 [compost metagenome]
MTKQVFVGDGGFPQQTGDTGKQPDGCLDLLFREFHLLVVEEHDARGAAHPVRNGLLQAIAIVTDQVPFGRRVTCQGNGPVIRSPWCAGKGQGESGTVLYPLQDLLPPGVAQERIMTGTVVDLIEDGEYAVVIE